MFTSRVFTVFKGRQNLYTEFGMPSSHAQFMWFFVTYTVFFIWIRWELLCLWISLGVSLSLSLSRSVSLFLCLFYSVFVSVSLSSLTLSLCVFVSLSFLLCVCVCLSVFSHSVTLCLCFSIFFTLCLCLSLCLCLLSLCHSVSLFLYLFYSVFVSVSLSLSSLTLSLCVFVSLSFLLCVCVCLSVSVFSHSVTLCLCLPVSPSLSVSLSVSLDSFFFSDIFWGTGKAVISWVASLYSFLVYVHSFDLHAQNAWVILRPGGRDVQWCLSIACQQVQLLGFSSFDQFFRMLCMECCCIFLLLFSFFLVFCFVCLFLASFFPSFFFPLFSSIVQNQLCGLALSFLVHRSGILFLSLSVMALLSLPSNLILKLTSSDSVLTNNSSFPVSISAVCGCVFHYN